MALVHQVSGTPYVLGGDSPAGTDCSGLVSWVANVATGRPAFGDRFHTGNQEQALLARGFRYGTAPNALVIGWNSHHTAATLPDGTPVSSGEGGGVKIGGGGAYQPQFTKHMFLPIEEIATPPGEWIPSPPGEVTAAPPVNLPAPAAEAPVVEAAPPPPPANPFAPPPPVPAP